MSFLSRNREVWLRRADAFSDSKWGVGVLALISFADSSVLPVMPDLLLVPMLLLRPDQWLRLSAACVAASSVGGLVGYGIGHFAWAAVGQTLVDMYGQAEHFQHYQHMVEKWGLWIIIAKSFTPIPYKFIAIASGVASMNLWTFTIATVIGRALHFAIITALAVLWGQQLLHLIEKYERWLVGLGVIVALGFGLAFAMR
ncbi:MAG TPA: VTT domain-containing protein [Bradyrhizobium sp.]|nr:VTT domain-containing protein [Bradyrhizobium sp.]